MKRIDMDTWERREPYRYFSAMDCPYWSMTCELDLTRARDFMRQNSIPSYVGTIWLVTRAANAVPEFKLRVVGGEVYDCGLVHPSFTAINNAGRLIFCRSQYTPGDPASFIESARLALERGRIDPDPPLAAGRQDLIYLSCIPWSHFTHVSHPVNFTPQDAIPRVTWGRFEERGAATLLAVNVHVHHGLADGKHVSLFMNTLEGYFRHPGQGFEGLPRP
jgi:chloramphenicol O-acetyltransferase type A